MNCTTDPLGTVHTCQVIIDSIEEEAFENHAAGSFHSHQDDAIDECGS
jgi:hypothetical protein